MMERWFRSLSGQISLFAMIVGLCTISVAGMLLYAGSSRVVLRQSIETSTMAVEKGGASVSAYIERLIVMSELLANQPAAQRALASPERSGERDTLAFIHGILRSDPYIQSVILIGKDGYVISNERDLNMTLSSDMMQESWYVAALESGGTPALTSARMQKFSMDRDNWVISVSREVLDRNGEHLGVALLDIRYKGIEDALRDMMLGSRGFAFILSRRGEPVYHRDPSYFTDAAKKSELIAIRDGRDGYDGSRNTLVHQTTVGPSDWTLVGVSSLDGLAQIRRQLLGTFLGAGAALFVLILIVAPWVSGRMTHPIRRLERAMQKVQQGALDVSVTGAGVAEVRQLSQHFNVMVQEIKRLMKDMEQKEKALRTYELNVLHGQINPHFLYNTLDTIVWMAEWGDSERVIEVTKALAKFFQLSLSGGSEYTTLQNELSHVGQYLFIQKERYGDKLTYAIEADPELHEMKLPKIILQPLAENAVYHGIREKAGPGHIRIAAVREGDRVVMLVEDDGVGFASGDGHPAPEGGGSATEGDRSRPDLARSAPESGRPEAREARLPEQTQTGNRRDRVRLGGVGMRNVDERLKLYYGEEYGVTVESRPGEGAKVRVTIPWSGPDVK